MVARPVMLYGVVSAETDAVVEFFLDRDAAAAFIAEVENDEPETAARRAVRRIRWS
jgi:hypothetical protein